MSETLKEIINDEKRLNELADKAFDTVDSDNSGLLTEDELFLVLNQICEDLGLDEITVPETYEILEMTDNDKSGKLDKKEFRELFKLLLRATSNFYNKR